MFPWLNKGCVYIAVLSGKSDILWDYRDMLYKFAEHNHFKIEVVLTKSKEALLQSISIFSRKPDIIIVADPFSQYQYRTFIERLERRRSRAKVFFLGAWEVPEVYEKKVFSYGKKEKIERYLEKEIDWILRKKL